MSALGGLAMIVVFAIAAYLMYARLLPALLAVPLMALTIGTIGGAGLSGLATILTDGSVRLAPVIATVIFGAILSRVTMATGIAESIVAYAAEYGGDRPAVLAIVLSAAVALLFTSLTGLGAIIMVGSIVLPIMMTIGVPRKTAATLFLLAFALGFIFNISQWTFYTATFGVTQLQMTTYALVLGALDLVALLVFAAVRFRATRGYATWALATDEPLARKRVPALALLTPIIPIGLYYGAHCSPLVAFSLAAIFGAVLCAPRDAAATLAAAAIRGVEDVAPAIVLFLGIGMLLAATATPGVRAALAPVVTTFAPHSWLGYVVLFGLLSPLALYRGPLNPFGVGIAVYTVLAGLKILPPPTLVAAVMAVVQVQNVCDPTNTQNVWVANFTGVPVATITRLTLPFQIAVATLATLAVAFFGGPLLGTRPLGAVARPAAAATEPPRNAMPGLFADPSVAGHIGVAAAGDDGAASVIARDEIIKAIGRGWLDFRALAVPENAADGDCAHKAFVAIAHVHADDREIGIELADCANWPVAQWYVPRTSDVREAALSALFRMRTWTVERPELARSLFARGLALDTPGSPTYLYTLFKTPDGQLRAYVRAGGPASIAGLRTNDVVVKIDGRYWWELGTFQAQARAYDGLPHRFGIARGHVADVTTITGTVTLGAPLVTAP